MWREPTIDESVQFGIVGGFVKLRQRVRPVSASSSANVILDIMDTPMPRWFLAFVAAAATLALVLMFVFVKTGATQNTKPAPAAGVTAK